MSDVLSQNEIDQLLTAISSGDVPATEEDAISDQRIFMIYDFKRPDKFSKDQIRTVSIMHETFARLTTTSFLINDSFFNLYAIRSSIEIIFTVINII